MTLFELETRREISAAYYNFYAEPALHPDRVMHEHDFVYICEGSWEVFQDGLPFQLEEGDVLLLTAGHHHYGELPCKEGTRTMYIHVSPADDRNADTDDGEPEGYVLLPEKVSCGQFPRVKRLFETIVYEYSLAEPPLYQARLSALFGLLLVELSAALQRAEPLAQDPLVKEVLDFIHANPQRFFTGEELAKRFFVCSKTLISRFRSEKGVTPYQYQLQNKLYGAESYLKEHPTATLREAAKNFGFYDEFHFSRQFKKMFGVPPGEYRKVNARG